MFRSLDVGIYFPNQRVDVGCVEHVRAEASRVVSLANLINHIFAHSIELRRLLATRFLRVGMRKNVDLTNETVAGGGGARNPPMQTLHCIAVDIIMHNTR